MMQPMVIRLPDKEKKLLQLEAQSKGVPVSEVAREAIMNHLKKTPRKSGAQILLKWADRKEKAGNKKTDLSTTYKQYLYGKKSKKFGYVYDKKTK